MANKKITSAKQKPVTRKDIVFADVAGSDVKKKQDKKPATDEISSAKKDLVLFQNYQMALANPSIAITEGGRANIYGGLGIFDKMENDSSIYTAMQQRILALLGCPIVIMPNQKSGKIPQRRDVEFIQNAIDQCWTFKAALEQSHCIARGYSVSEIMWAIDGERVIIEELRGRRQERFYFDIDQQLRLSVMGNAIGELMPQMKFSTMRYWAINDNPYGYGIHNRCYWDYWFKKHGWIYAMKFAESFGSPTPYGKYKPQNKGQKDEILNILKDIQQDSAFVVPEGWEIAFLEAQRTSTLNIYEMILDRCEAGIVKTYLGQTLTTSQGNIGSQALGTVHYQVKQELTIADAHNQDIMLDENIIKPLCFYNGIENPPYAQTQVNEAIDLKALAERDKILVECGLTIGKKYFYETYSIPEPESGEETVTPLAPASPFGNIPAMNPAEKQSSAFAENDQAGRVIEGKTQTWNWAIDQMVTELANHYAEMRGQIRMLLKTADTFDGALQVIEGIESKDILANYLHETIRRGMLAGAESWVAAMNEQGAKFAEAPVSAEMDWSHSVTPDEAINFWKAKVPVAISAYKKLDAAAKKKAFSVSGVEDEYLRTAIKDKIQQAMKQGLTYQEFYDGVNGVFDAVGISPLKPWHLETVARTNMMSACNEGQNVILQSPEVLAAFPFVEYTAILDSRTRPEHAAISGQVVPAEVAMQYDGPPWDYNCRCSKVPRTKDYAEAVGIIEAFKPPPGFFA